MKFVLMALALVAASPAAQSSPSADQIIAQTQAAFNKGVKTFEVPVTMNGKVRAGPLSVPVSASGTQYFQAPDRIAMRMRNLPGPAKGFENSVNNVGTPSQWAKTYAFAYNGTSTRDGQNVYVLSGPPRNSGSRVKAATLYIDTQSYDVRGVHFDYNDGSTIDGTRQFKDVGTYHLVGKGNVSASFPQYKGTAELDYGDYKINGPIDPSVFQK